MILIIARRFSFVLIGYYWLTEKLEYSTPRRAHSSWYVLSIYYKKKKKQCYFLITHTHRPGATWTCSRCEFWRARRVNHTKNNTLKYSAILHTQTSHKVYILQDILTLFARNLYSRSTLRGWITIICTWLFMIQVPPRHICSQGIVLS